MSQKFFTLIHGESIHIAPGTKKISSEAVGKLCDAQEVMEEVKQDATKYRVAVTAECEELKELARKEGYEQGYSDWVEKVAEMEREIQQVHDKVEQVILPVALKAAKKIVCRELEVSKDVIIDIVENNLKAVAQHKKIKIYVSKEDLETVEKNRPRIREIFENLEALSIQERSDISPGGCVIETEGGIINAQIENQWTILENAFQKLLKKQNSGV